MTLVKLPVLNVLIGKLLAVNDQQVLSVPLLSRFCEVERPCDNGFSVDDHDLVVGDCMDSINLGRYTSLDKTLSDRVFLRFLALIQKNLNSGSPFMRSHQSIGDRDRREGICLNKDDRFCFIESLAQSKLSSSMWRKVDVAGEIGTP
jgi:hypothetical protein